jgi:hypothetical protein
MLALPMTLRANALALLVAGVAACSATKMPGPAAPAATSEPTPALAIDRRAPPTRSPAMCMRDPSLTPVDAPLYDEGKRALDEGDPHRARAIFAHIVNAYRQSAPLLACYNAATAAILDARRKAGAKDTFDVVAPKALPPPPYGTTATLVTPAREKAGLGPRTTAKLVKASEKKNGITDEGKWYAEGGLVRPQYFLPSPSDYMFVDLQIYEHDVPWPVFEAHTYAPWARDPSLLPEPLPLTIPLRYGTLQLRTALSSGEYVIAAYGQTQGLSPYLAIFRRDGSVVGFFDLGSYALGPGSKVVTAKVGSMTLQEGGRTVAQSDLYRADVGQRLDLKYAVASGSVLYVEHAVNGYTKESNGQTGFLTAIDMATGALLWRSAPQVANTQTFLVDAPRGVIVSAFGFTAEPRFLYVIDASTGATVQKTQVQATPEIFVKKDDVIHLRGYDRDYTFIWK